jgi:coatomer subunit beta
LKSVIYAHLNGEPQNSLMMSIIRFVVPTNNKPLKKLLLYYWEIVDKKSKDGKIKPELILVW